ncbi:hypothetical protein BGX20_000803 [Mortierella sp. AD010]|nr:hypothetical protein BGX20_000803 [Mortierella sp. AD010]
MPVTFQEFKFGENKERLNLISSKSPQEPHFIYFPSVLKAFRIQDAVGFETNGEFKVDGAIVDYMRDDSGFLIPCIPGRIIEVFYKTPQTDSTSLRSISTRESLMPLNESVDQLSIKSQLSADLDPSESLHFGLPRKSTAQIREDMKVVTDAMIARNRAGKPLDAHFVIDISRPAEYHTSIVSNVTAKPRFESRIMEELKEIRMNVKENLELSKQMNDRLILIQSKTEAILTQQLELAEYPIP